MWPLDKLSLINQALVISGNDPVAAENDGSPEWTIGSAAWDSAIEALFEEHDWGFLTQVTTLQRAGTPTDPRYSDAYAKPPDCMHVIWVRLAMSSGNDAPTQYMIVNNQIILNATGQVAPVSASSTRGVVTLKYVSNHNGPEQWSPLFLKALRFLVMSGIYRGLNEDFGEADKLYAAGTQTVQEARTRSDQEMPKRAPFNSRYLMSRRLRRPWTTMPPGWTDTGRVS